MISVLSSGGCRQIHISNHNDDRLYVQILLLGEQETRRVHSTASLDTKACLARTSDVSGRNRYGREKTQDALAPLSVLLRRETSKNSTNRRSRETTRAGLRLPEERNSTTAKTDLCQGYRVEFDVKNGARQFLSFCPWENFL